MDMTMKFEELNENELLDIDGGAFFTVKAAIVLTYVASTPVAKAAGAGIVGGATTWAVNQISQIFN